MKQRIVPRRRSGKLRRGQMQDRLDIAYDDCLYETSWSLRSLTTGTVVATSGFNRAEFGYLLSQFVGSVSGDEHQLVIHDSVVGCMCLRNCGRFSLAHYVRQRCASHELDKEHLKCVVHRIPNDDLIADSARATVMLSRSRLSLRRARERYCPTRHLRSIASKTLARPRLGRAPLTALCWSDLTLRRARCATDQFIAARCYLAIHVRVLSTGNTTKSRPLYR
jgi:hypothetical protein